MSTNHKLFFSSVKVRSFALVNTDMQSVRFFLLHSIAITSQITCFALSYNISVGKQKENPSEKGATIKIPMKVTALTKLGGSNSKQITAQTPNGRTVICNRYELPVNFACQLCGKSPNNHNYIAMYRKKSRGTNENGRWWVAITRKLTVEFPL